MKTGSGQNFFIKHIEFILSLVIVICVVLQMLVFDYTVNSLSERYSDTLFIPENYVDTIDPELEALIREYNPNSQKMIEVYTEDYDLALRINFDDSNNLDESYNDIKDYSELMEYFTKNREGHTFYKTDDHLENDLYFRWYLTNSHEGQNGEHLVLIFMSRPEETSYVLSRVISCTILILAFMIVLISIRKQRDEKIRLMMSNSRNISNQLYNE